MKEKKDNKRPIRVMYVYHHLAIVGGIERVLTDKMNYLSDNGFVVSLITYEQGSHPIAFHLSKEIIHTDLNTRFFPLDNYPLIIRLIKKFKTKLLLQHRLQVQVNSFRPDIIVVIAGDIRTCDILNKIKTSAKKIAESHTNIKYTMSDPSKRNGILSLLINKLYIEYQCRKIRKMDMLVTLTDGSAKEWRKYTKNITVIPNPLTLYPTEINTKKEFSNRIISVGRFDYQKGFDILVKAFTIIADKCPNWSLEIFGEGNDKTRIKNMISYNNLENRIHLHPASSTIYEEYKKSDFYVMSSRYEGFGLVLIEAMSCGLPCISFRCKHGPEDIITNDIDGILVKDGDYNELAETILWLCNHPTQILEMSCAAREKAQKYKKENIMPLWIKLFHKLSEPSHQ
ncbi:glycosyltransferase family 4 protein [Xylanibacter ruminicola]|uniref:glycosyltransferase family 4 protein n=1 Tax=Xylanibacter ruminicola TaxID=839 RepID=UPI000490A1EA|nr:glycosyltransferase family 4 protein [Xylanibacter ruminicola]